jgi:hypothetical protein
LNKSNELLRGCFSTGAFAAVSLVNISLSGQVRAEGGVNGFFMPAFRVITERSFNQPQGLQTEHLYVCGRASPPEPPGCLPGFYRRGKGRRRPACGIADTILGKVKNGKRPPPVWFNTARFPVLNKGKFA